MKKYNMLATAVGAVVGYGIIEALRLSGYGVNIIGCDIYPDAAGRFFADEFVAAEPAASANYLHFLTNLIDEKRIDMVFFGIEQEITAVSANRSALSEYLGKLLIQDKRIIDLCDDKWLTARWLEEHGLEEYVIDSAIDGNFWDLQARLGKEFLIKPRVSRGAKGIVPVKDAFDFDYFKCKLGDNFMAQHIVGDDEHEYTAGVFGLGDGSFANAIFLRRKLSQEGATAKAWVVEDPELLVAARRITEALRPTGPTNYQFRKEGDGVFLLEINPRISSSVSIRSKLGYNEVAMSIEFFLEGRIPAKAEIKQGYAVRYISDRMIVE